MTISKNLAHLFKTKYFVKKKKSINLYNLGHPHVINLSEFMHI